MPAGRGGEGMEKIQRGRGARGDLQDHGQARRRRRVPTVPRDVTLGPPRLVMMRLQVDWDVVQWRALISRIDLWGRERLRRGIFYPVL